MGASRTSAVLPSGEYVRPRFLDLPPRQVHFVDDVGRSRTFDFNMIDAAPTLVEDLITAFANGAAPGRRWQTLSTASTVASALRSMALFLDTNFPEVTTLETLGPEVWWTWRSEKDTNRWPGQVNTMRALLSESPKLPEPTRRAMRAKTTKPRKRLAKNDAYSSAEFHAIRTAASHRVNQALRRIEMNSAALQGFLDGTEIADSPVIRTEGVEWTRGSLLHYLAQVGMLPSEYLATRAKLKGLFDLRGVSNPAQALFASIDEIYCLMILLACERGFNLAVMANLTVSSFESSDQITESPVHTVSIDKPRRGAKRHSDEILAGEAGKLWGRAVKLTQPCRDALQSRGTPTNKLLVAHRHKDLNGRGPFRKDWATAFLAGYRSGHVVSKGDDGQPIRVSFQRLRLSEQLLSQHARQNSESVSEDIYRRPDPTTIEAASDTVEEAQADAVNHAVATMSVRAMTAADVTAALRDPSAAAARLGVPVTTLKLLLAGNLDTPTGACVDFFNSPFSTDPGDPCPASFFACFACGNSVITPRHLPRLVVLLDALDAIATVVTPSRWEVDYAPHYARLRSVITTNATDPEIQKARRAIEPAEHEMISRLLKRNLDA
jgi:hypothetical protein